MARDLPTNLTDLRKIPGFSSAQHESYGKKLLQICVKYAKEKAFNLEGTQAAPEGPLLVDDDESDYGTIGSGDEDEDEEDGNAPMFKPLKANQRAFLERMKHTQSTSAAKSAARRGDAPAGTTMSQKPVYRKTKKRWSNGSSGSRVGKSSSSRTGAVGSRSAGSGKSKQTKIAAAANKYLRPAA
jgi:hypothetical protein